MRQELSIGLPGGEKLFLDVDWGGGRLEIRYADDARFNVRVTGDAGLMVHDWGARGGGESVVETDVNELQKRTWGLEAIVSAQQQALLRWRREAARAEARAMDEAGKGRG